MKKNNPGSDTRKKLPVIAYILAFISMVIIALFVVMTVKGELNYSNKNAANISWHSEDKNQTSDAVATDSDAETTEDNKEKDQSTPSETDDINKITTPKADTQNKGTKNNSGTARNAGSSKKTDSKGTDSDEEADSDAANKNKPKGINDDKLNGINDDKLNGINDDKLNGINDDKLNGINDNKPN